MTRRIDTLRTSRSLASLACLHILLLAGSTTIAAVARAAVTSISQTREVSAFASISPADGGESQFDSQQQSSPDPGSFSDSVTASVEEGATLAEGFATQTSIIEPGLIQASGLFHARAELAEGIPFAEGMGFTRLTHRFQVEGTTPYTIAGTLEGAGAGRAFVSLVRQNSGAIVYLTVEESVQPVYLQGVLETGIYDFSVWTFGFGQAIAPDENNPASGRFQMSLSFADPLAAPEPPVATDLRVWPNPVRTGTTISLGRDGGPGGEIAILDVAGRMVRSLGRPEGGSIHSDARDDSGDQAARGDPPLEEIADERGKGIDRALRERVAPSQRRWGPAAAADPGLPAPLVRDRADPALPGVVRPFRVHGAGPDAPERQPMVSVSR